MAAAKQLKRVSWPPDVRLRQVRLFLSEDAPCQLRVGSQEHLQAKGSWLQHSGGMGTDDSLLPGFEVTEPTDQFDISQIPLVKWQCPPRMALNAEWLVVAGDESNEIALEDQRVLGVLEAIYPRPSAIPSDPAVSSKVENSHQDDSLTLSVPITAVEDEDTSERFDSMAPVEAALVQLERPDKPKSTPEVRPHQARPDVKFALGQPHDSWVPTSVQHLPLSQIPLVGATTGAQSDVVAAVSAAFTAITRSSEEASMIDHDLLIKILRNPWLIENLASEYGPPKESMPLMTSKPPQPLPSNISPTTYLPPRSAFPTTDVVRPTAMNPEPTNVVRPALNSQPSSVARFPAANLPGDAPVVKDRSFYKSLIQLHGEERQESPDPNPMHFGRYYNQPGTFVGVNGVEGLNSGAIQRDQKPKILKPCAYFNTPRGCRNGASCLYQHDGSSSRRVEHQKSLKRIKLDKEIAGRT